MTARTPTVPPFSMLAPPGDPSVDVLPPAAPEPTDEPWAAGDRGGLLPITSADNEPPPSSAVLADGLYGTIYTRWRKDGLWHSAVTGKTMPWTQLVTKNNKPGNVEAGVHRLFLVYRAPGGRS